MAVSSVFRGAEPLPPGEESGDGETRHGAPGLGRLAVEARLQRRREHGHAVWVPGVAAAGRGHGHGGAGLGLGGVEVLVEGHTGRCTR